MAAFTDTETLRLRFFVLNSLLLTGSRLRDHLFVDLITSFAAYVVPCHPFRDWIYHKRSEVRRVASTVLVFVAFVKQQVSFSSSGKLEVKARFAISQSFCQKSANNWGVIVSIISRTDTKIIFSVPLCFRDIIQLRLRKVDQRINMLTNAEVSAFSLNFHCSI